MQGHEICMKVSILKGIGTKSATDPWKIRFQTTSERTHDIAYKSIRRINDEEIFNIGFSGTGNYGSRICTGTPSDSVRIGTEGNSGKRPQENTDFIEE